MSDIPLVKVSQQIVDRRTAAYVNADTGAAVDENHPLALLLDMQTANVIVMVYGAISDKAKFGRIVEKQGVAKTAEVCWGCVG